MRALFITQLWEPAEGPSQRRIRQFSHAWIKAGGESTILTTGQGRATSYPSANRARNGNRSPHRKTDEAGRRVIRARQFGLGGSITFRILDQGLSAIQSIFLGSCEALSNNRPKVIVATVPAIPSAYTGVILSTLFRAPLVIDLRDAWPDLISELGRWHGPADGNRRSRLSSHLTETVIRTGGKLLHHAISRADLVVTTSEWLEKSLRDRGLEEVVTIRNSPSGHDVSCATRKERSPDQELRILYAGTVGRAQGLSNAIDAAKIAIDSGVKLRLRIVGEGAELESVKFRARQLGSAVEFVHAVPHSEMAAHYSWADASLVHLRDWEPLKRTIPSKLIEAMAIKIPVSLAADGESAQVVLDTGAGDVAAPMDPGSLAHMWQEWDAQGVRRPDSQRVQRWLSANATPSLTSGVFVQQLESVVAGSKRAS